MTDRAHELPSVFQVDRVIGDAGRTTRTPTIALPQFPVQVVAVALSAVIGTATGGLVAAQASPAATGANVVLASQAGWAVPSDGRPSPQLLAAFRGALTPGAITNEDIERIRDEWRS